MSRTGGEGSIVGASGVDSDEKEGRVVEKYDLAIIGIVISWLMEAYSVKDGKVRHNVLLAVKMVQLSYFILSMIL